MSQEYNGTVKKYRRARTQRNRPVLVTGNENTVEEQTAREEEPVEETPSQEVATELAPEPVQPSKGRRLPNFFSTVGKSEKEESKKKTDVVQARLARATKGKASTATGKTAAVTTEEKEDSAKGGEKVTATSAGSPARPNQGFKTRYILGIAIYLFAANFIGTGITILLNQWHADAVLANVPIFGGIKTSTVLFLAVLIIILVLLARFDLIPRSLAPAATSQKSGKSGESTPRQPTSPIRQGVKGEDDDLYQEYRLSQRRSKKH